MKTTIAIAAAAAALLSLGLPAQAHDTGYAHGGAHAGFGYTAADSRYVQRYKPVPGCCANAPYPREQLVTKRYFYRDGTQVIVYPYENGAGYQPFWWQH